jgi:hypothetical protein
MDSSERVPLEKFFVVFATNSFAPMAVIHGCEQQAWKFLQSMPNFDELEGYVPTTETKRGMSSLLFASVVLADIQNVSPGCVSRDALGQVGWDHGLSYLCGCYWLASPFLSDLSVSVLVLSLCLDLVCHYQQRQITQFSMSFSTKADYTV